MKKIIITLPKNETLNGQPIYARIMIPKENLKDIEEQRFNKKFNKKLDYKLSPKEKKGECFLYGRTPIRRIERLFCKVFRESRETIVGPVLTFLGGSQEKMARVQAIFY